MKRITAVVFCALLTACPEDTPPSGGAAAAADTLGDATQDVPEPRYDASPRRPDAQTCVVHPPPPPAGRLRLERAFPHALADGARLRQAVELGQAPDDPTRWFLIRQPGEVLTFTTEPGAPGAAVALDLAARIDLQYSESGLVGMALHPAFAVNGAVFLVYTAPTGQQGSYFSRLSRFTHMGGGTLDPDSEQILLDIRQTSPTHSGNHIAFGPDGTLYYSVGDDRKTDRHGQDPGTIQGALLRIDVDTPDPAAGRLYSIPPDNPFAAGGGAGEVFAYGFRNPWRFGFDRVTGDLYLGDVGQDRREEIDRIVPGGNYGWPLKEGSLCFRQEPCDPPGLIDPLVEYTHGEGTAVVAGFVVRAGTLPELSGRLLYGDYITGNIWSIDPTQPAPATRLELEGTFPIASFARGADDTLYVVRYDVTEDGGGVYRLAPSVPETSDFPQTLSATGCVDTADPRRPAASVVAYEPAARLWSDGADKDRYLAIPSDRRLDVRKDGSLALPTGTVLVKHFRFGERFHETRLLMRTDAGWNGYSFEWNDAQTDATLLPGARAVTLPNGVRWQYPSRSACLRCHTEVAHHVLGLEVAQLDHAVARSPDGAAQNQLAWLLEHDYFAPELTSLDAVRGGRPALPDPFGEAPLADRARAYLHANCGGCHRPDGPGRGNIDLRFTTPFAATGLCDAEPQEGRLWDIGVWDDQLLLRPGRPDDSILVLRMALQGFFRMPPLGTDVVHAEGVALVRSWIQAMEGCPPAP